MFTTFKTRDITPTNYRYATKEDPKAKFESDFAEFLSGCAEFEAASKQHIYESKEEVPQISFRVHCGWLASLISFAQRLIFENESLVAEFPDLELQLKILQQKTDEFVVRLYDWHGAPGTHSDELPSFNQAVLEVQKHEIENFDL